MYLSSLLVSLIYTCLGIHHAVQQRVLPNSTNTPPHQRDLLTHPDLRTSLYSVLRAKRHHPESETKT